MASRLAWFREEHGSFRYHLERDDGTFDESKLPADEIRAEARQSHKSIRSVIEKRLGLSETPETVVELAEPETPPAEALPEVQRHTHREFALPVSEHEHSLSEHDHAVPEHDHPHKHEGVYSTATHGHPHLEDALANQSASQTRVSLEISRVAETLATHGHSAKPHAHPDLVSAELLTQVMERVKLLAQGHLDLERRIAALEQKPEPPFQEHEHPEYGHEHAFAATSHKHPEYEVEATRKRQARQDGHEHVWNTWSAEGWRCGVCNKLKGDD